MEKITLSTLQLLELEILAQYALYRAFEPASVPLRNHLPESARAGLGGTSAMPAGRGFIAAARVERSTPPDIRPALWQAMQLF